ncbi:MAG: leucine-rich repeat protein [Bacilli bacterium]|nr:leucine-rich repeat protein [Bacilli bacterium]
MNKKKLTPLIITGGGILVSLFVIMSSYAYWQITKKQKSPNEMVSACLNLVLENADPENTGISLGAAWPISDEEGRNLDGYTFTVENKCPYDVNYIIGLESLEVAGATYLDYKYIRLAIDDEIEKTYENLTTIDNVILEGDAESIRETKEVTTATVKANKTNSHNIKLWLAEETPLTQQNRAFKSRVMITGGQGIENNNVPATEASCFTLDEEGKGEIIGYNASCGTNVVIPAKINGTEVKTIDTNAFKTTATNIVYFDSEMNEESSIDVSDAVFSVVIDNYTRGDEIDWSNLVNIVNYGISYTDNEDINTQLESMLAKPNQKLYRANSTTEPAPEMVVNQLMIYMTAEASPIGFKYLEEQSTVSIKSLDLSKVIYLETIEESAFSNVPANVTNLTEYSNYKTSLTSLTFGENNKELIFGHNAFANIDVDDLTIYASYLPGCPSDSDSITVPFANASVANLDVKATPETTKLFDRDNPSYMYPANDPTAMCLRTTPLMRMKVQNMNINEGITEIDRNDNYPFGDSTFENVTLPNTLDLVTDYGVFQSAEYIGNLQFAAGRTEIGESSFWDAYIKRVTIPASVTNIGESAFGANHITGILEEVVFEDTTTKPSQLTTIGNSAFGNQTKIKTITIPNSVNSIGDYAFSGMTNTSTIAFHRTQADVTSNVSLGTNWSGSANVTYEQ